MLQNTGSYLFCQAEEYGFCLVGGDIYAGDGFWLLGKAEEYGFCRCSSLVTLVTRRKETDDIRNGQGSDFYIFSFVVRCRALSFILRHRRTGSSRGCSPLQPSPGSTGPWTRSIGTQSVPMLLPVYPLQTSSRVLHFIIRLFAGIIIPQICLIFKSCILRSSLLYYCHHTAIL